jgi:hypothetical protein
VIRRDCALALSMQVGYQEVATYDDRVKATLWELLEDQADAMKGGGGG